MQMLALGVSLGTPPRSAKKIGIASARNLVQWCIKMSCGDAPQRTGGRKIGSVDAHSVATLPGQEGLPQMIDVLKTTLPPEPT